jgi:murein tripeptide amidase MpaA
MRKAVTLVWLLAVVALPAEASAQLALSLDRYHSFAEMTAFLQEAARKYPDLARLTSIGKSYQGRDLWLLEVTNRKTGPADAKPALYVNGCLDSAEVVTTEGVLYTIKRLLEGYGRDPAITAIVDTRTLYFVPRIMPDQTEVYITTPLRARSRSAKPEDDDGDGKLDEDPDDDLDGDGHIVQMRVKDPDGEWKVSDKDPRLMVRRRPGELEGTFYRVLVEGKDDDGDGKYNEDPLGGVDPNRNYPGNWRPVHIQPGAGPYPLYVQEVRAEVEFLETHRNIAAYVNHHSSGGVVLRPSTTHDDSTIPADDLRLLRTIGAMLLDATGYWLATSVYDWRYPPGTPDTKPGQTWRRPDGSLANDPREGAGPGGMAASAPAVPPAVGAAAPAPTTRVAGGAAEQAGDEHVVPLAEGEEPFAYHAWGGSIEFTYEVLGMISYASEQWRMAFDHDLDRNGSISDLERLAWNDAHFGGDLFVNWKPFRHPQLGEVEIGGWKKNSTGSPPPGKYLEDESERQFRFNLLMARLLPRIEVGEIRISPLGGGVFKVVAEIRNAGYIPTATEMQRTLGRIPPATAVLGGTNVEVLGGDARRQIGHLRGAPAEPATAEWLVRATGPGPASVTITASAVTAGRDAKTVTLPAGTAPSGVSR